MRVPKDRLDMEIEELRLLMVKMYQRRNEERMNIYISRENRQNSDKRRLHCNIKFGNQEN